MKKSLQVPVVLIAMISAGASFGAAPGMISYQANLTDTAGQGLNGTYPMTFTIYDGPGSEAGVLWQESQSVQVTNGLFYALLGSVTPLTDGVFGDTARYLGIVVGNPNDPEIYPRTRLASSPYSFRVQTIDEATGGDIYGDVTLHSILRVGWVDGEAGYIHMFNGASQTVQISGKDVTGIGDEGSLIRLENGADDATITLDADDFEAGDVGSRVTLSDGVVETIVLNAYDVNTGGANLIMAFDRDAILDTTVAIHAHGDAGDGGGIIRLYDDDATKTVHIDANGATYGGAQLSLSDHDGTTTISMDAESGGFDAGASVVLQTGADPPVNTIHLDANDGGDGGGILKMYDDDATKTVHIDAHGVSYGGAQVSLSDHDGTTTISLDAESGASDGGANVRLLTGTGVETVRLDADYGGTGEGRVITSVLEITGGADLSEQFEIRFGKEDPAATPGMVVCIDPAHPGQLVISSRAYDPTVAGIISGAGGIKPGMLMGQAGSESDGRFAVALTGRVYCRADATYGAIKPGDLLTTSDTPGHAMKAGNSARTQGAVLGKAMTTLDEGRGLVLVLVSLQ